MYLRTPKGSAQAIGDIYLSSPRGSARRYAMGDGPVTSTTQDPTTGEIQMPDDYVSTWNPSNEDETVATVGPIITGVKDTLVSTADWIKQQLTGGGPTITTTVTGTGPAASVSGSGPNLLLLAALGGAGYLAYKHFSKKKRK